MSTIAPTILKVIARTISNPYGLPEYGGVLAPPIPDKLLVWLKGNSTDTQKLDSWKQPDAENMDMVQSAAIYLNGTDETGTTSSNLGTLDSYEGTAVLSYDGTTITATEGTAYNLQFSNGAVFPCAEVSPTATHSFSTDGQHSIEWNGTLANMRAGRQDSYHYNATEGFGYRENQIPYSESFENSQWSPANGLTKTTGISDPFGGTKAAQLEATIDNGTLLNLVSNITEPSEIKLWVRRVSGTGVVEIYNGSVRLSGK